MFTEVGPLLASSSVAWPSERVAQDSLKVEALGASFWALPHPGPSPSCPPPQAAASMCDLESGSVKVKEPSGRGRGQGGWYERLVQPCLVELLGSALFIFIGCLSVIENGPDTGRLQPALAHGLALGLVIATLGNIRWEQRWALRLGAAGGRERHGGQAPRGTHPGSPEWCGQECRLGVRLPGFESWLLSP